MSISIELARKIVEASKQYARELRSPISIAIVDAGGHLVIFERMMAPYGWATGNISIAKATSAVMFNQSTDAIAQWGSGIPGFASSMAAMTEGKFIMAAGGWPIRVNGATVGGIGVSGGNAPGRDDEIARAGLAAIETNFPPHTQHVVPGPSYSAPPVPQAPFPIPSALAGQGEQPQYENPGVQNSAQTMGTQGVFYTRQLAPDKENSQGREPSEQFQDDHPGDHS